MLEAVAPPCKPVVACDTAHDALLIAVEMEVARQNDKCPPPVNKFDVYLNAHNKCLNATTRTHVFADGSWEFLSAYDVFKTSTTGRRELVTPMIPVLLMDKGDVYIELAAFLPVGVRMQVMVKVVGHTEVKVIDCYRSIYRPTAGASGQTMFQVCSRAVLGADFSEWSPFSAPFVL